MSHAERLAIMQHAFWHLKVKDMQGEVDGAMNSLSAKDVERLPAQKSMKT